MKRYLFLRIAIGGVCGLGVMCSLSGPRVFLMLGPLTAEIGIDT